MHLATTTRLATKSILNRKVTALLTILAVAVSVMLFVGVETVRQGARASFERTISGADLVVGARSSPINLVLYSIFNIGDPVNNITWQAYQEIAERPEVAWTIPISLGDSHRGYRVVGTSTDYFTRYQFGEGQNLSFRSGEAFDDLFDVVLGAEVARTLDYGLGDEIVVAHGLGAVSFTNHEDKPFTVTGVLAPTGTPVDRSLFVSLEAIEAIHAGWQGGGITPVARMMTAERVRAMDLEPDSITAMIIGLNNRAAVLQLQRDINTYRAEPMLAVIPGVALSQLWEVVGVIERTLAAISACVVGVGLVVVLVSILTSLNERRREMAILRSVGARPSDIFMLLTVEAALLAFTGAVIGVVLLHAGLIFLAPLILTMTGVMISGVTPGLFEAAVIAAVSGIAALMAALPALGASRRALADGLTIRV